MSEILLHPWLTNKSFLGTELKFLQPTSLLEFDPLNHPQLQYPLIKSKTELDGRIWETLKVLWREKSEQDILTSLSTYGYVIYFFVLFLLFIVSFYNRTNLQKLTCKLLQERSTRLESQQQSVHNSSKLYPSLCNYFKY